MLALSRKVGEPVSGFAKGAFMIDNRCTTPDREVRIGNFAAELTSAAYRLVLRQGLEGSWLQVELALWGALRETVETWTRRRPPAMPSDEFDAWRERFLAVLTERAFAIALENGVEGPFLELELDLHRAFRLVTRRRSHVS
jgi:hypothetical protein